MTTFAEKFEQAWAKPTADRLANLLHSDVILYQPHLPPIKGKTAAREEFERLFNWLPNTYGRIIHTMESDPVVFIEWELILPLGKNGVVIPTVDRFIIEDGLGLERTVYFDRVHLIMSVLRHPGCWFGYLKYQFGS